MAYRQPLNERQMEVLRWIAEGCPTGWWTDFSYKTTCYALDSRGLADVDRRRESWSARITDAGRYYLEHGAYQEVTLDAVADRDPEPRRWPTADGAKVPSAAEYAAAVLQRVKDEGGIVDLGKVEWRYPEREIEGAARRSPWRVAGKTLRLHRYGTWREGGVQAYFEDDLAETVETQPVPVPERISRWHPAVVAYRNDPDRHEVTKTSLSRTARIVQALALESERRGHSLAHVPYDGGYYNDFRRAISGGQFRISIGDRSYPLRVREIAGRGGRQRDYRDRTKLPKWMDSRTHDFVPTGRLEISIESYSGSERPAKFRDGKRQTLEDQLPALLKELEVRVLEDAREAEKKERALERKRREWDVVMERAKERHREHHRAEALRLEAEAWAVHDQLASYVAAFREQLDSAGPGRAGIDGARQWLAWAEAHLAAADPFVAFPQTPAEPEHTREALAPFLDGWSFERP